LRFTLPNPPSLQDGFQFASIPATSWLANFHWPFGPGNWLSKTARGLGTTFPFHALDDFPGLTLSLSKTDLHPPEPGASSIRNKPNFFIKNKPHFSI
jgi:hypothetical protein